MNQIMNYYLEKKHYRDCILFYKNGIFYKAYEEDSILLSYLLNTNVKYRNSSFCETNLSEKDIEFFRLNYSICYRLEGKVYDYKDNQYSEYLKRAKLKQRLDKIYQSLLSEINCGSQLEEFFSVCEFYER